jgi:hypothetical protein
LIRACGGLADMGKTVPSYRMALEVEIEEWKDFKNALENELEKEAFEESMDMCRRNAMASGTACKPIIFEPMLMSILLAHQKKTIELEHKLSETRV